MVPKIIRLLILCVAFSCNIFANNLEETISGLIMNKLDSNIAELKLNFDYKSKSNFDRLQKKSIKNVQLIYFAHNYSSFKVNITTEDDMQYDLFGRYQAFIDIPVISRTVLAGNIVTESDITSSRIAYSKINSGYITSAGEVLGMQVKKGLSSGSLIRHGDIIKPQVVHQDDNVAITYHSGRIKLRTNGIALQNGAVGDSVRVRNESTGTIINGVVKARNLVEVGGE